MDLYIGKDVHGLYYNCISWNFRLIIMGLIFTQFLLFVVGYVLKFLISASKAKRVLEVGMFTGCGALGMAEVLPEDGKLTTCEFDPYVADLARTFLDKSPHGKKVEILGGKNSVKDGSFNF